MDSAWEQRKLKARKMLAEGVADSHPSVARFVGRGLGLLAVKCTYFDLYCDLWSQI
jgi:hypothetical protein